MLNVALQVLIDQSRRAPPRPRAEPRRPNGVTRRERYDRRVAVDWRARCDQLLSDTERDLVAAVGDASLCAISKSGERVDGVKYLEGRSAALREYRRELADFSGAEAHRAVVRRWRDHLQLAQERDMGPDWVAYRSGGVDALADLADQEARGAPPAG